MTVTIAIIKVIYQLKKLSESLIIKGVEFNDVIKMGRTQMQDTVPIRLGQEFKAFNSAICPFIGYEKTAGIAKLTLKTGEPIKDIILREGLLEKSELESILEPTNMTEVREYKIPSFHPTLSVVSTN